MLPHERIIVALDVPERDKTIELAKKLAGKVGMVKIGLESFIAHGPDLVREIVDCGTDVFLDLKIHDIPRTAGAAARQASQTGAKLLTIHGAGGADMVRSARDAALDSTEILAVTILTSLDHDATQAIGYGGSVADAAHRLAGLALGNGADGLVCSAHELERLSALGGHRVVPGIRPLGSGHGDQKRVATPEQAVSWGASWLVIGRPIVQAEDPVAAAVAIAESLGGPS